MKSDHSNRGEILERNLAALAQRSASAIEHIRRAPLPADLTISTAPDGGLTGTLGSPARQLASLRAPLAEAEKFAQGVDVATAAAVVVRGFGLGHHIAALAQRVKGHGAVIVFEPDAGLLRAILEQVDCTPWLRASNVSIVTDADNTGAIAAAVTGIEAMLAAGTVLLDHPPSRARLGEQSERFAAQFTTVMKAVRTNVVTSLVQVDVTLRNLLQNLPWYATVPGVADLKDSCKGQPAVVVSAGPSLRRNIDLLSQPGVRDNVVIIAVQTVLKTLLVKGIRPHYVTALDYHEISRRFYEGLTAKDVEGVTLIAEPKCSRAIMEAFPGDIRCPRDEVLDQVLGQKLARVMGELPPGATVAHLAYYFARYLGCDPVILIGQDLGFTDGQYYGPGAAIHQVWSSELNQFNTLEMLEWQRIARMRSILRRATDTLGRPMYTDEQMCTYLVQFERDFMQDAAKGLTTIDATQGGVHKAHTSVMTLKEALANAGVTGSNSRSTPATLPRIASTTRQDPARRLGLVHTRLTELTVSTAEITRLSGDAETLLKEMLDRQRDQARVNLLIDRVNELGRKAVPQPAYWLVQWLNQTGQFNRFRADRAIHIDPTIGEHQRQKMEIERDIINVRWLADAAKHVAGLLGEAQAALDFEKRTHTTHAQTTPTSVSGKIWACIHVDEAVGGLGTPRDLSRPFLNGKNPLQLTLARLACCQRIDGVVLMCRNVARIMEIVGEPPAGLALEFDRVDGELLRSRGRCVGMGRLWARHCWRGGLANLSIYDEALCPAVLAEVMEHRGLNACVVVGADWAMVDPAIIDKVIKRHLERPDVHELTFAHAPPGLGTCLLTRKIARELADANSPFASIGGLIGYLPLAPQSDPITKPVCVSVEPAVRDLLVRCIPDSRSRSDGLSAALSRLGDKAEAATAAEISHLLKTIASPSFGTESVTVCAGAIPTNFESLAQHSSDLVLNIIDDGTQFNAALSLAAAARRAGFAGIHLRTPLLGGTEQADQLLFAQVDVVSVDVLAETSETYEDLTGHQHFESVREGVTRLLEHRSTSAGMPRLWVVPRITRRDAVYEQVEDFYNRALMTAGACVIDPLPRAIAGDNIEPLPLPTNVVERLLSSTITISPDPTRGVVMLENKSSHGTPVEPMRGTRLAS